MEPAVHILMTGAGAPGAPGIIQCLRQDKRVKFSVADADAQAIGQHLHSPFFQIPNGGDENFIAELLTLCVREKIDLILPLVTKELLPLAQNKNNLESAGFKVLVSNSNAIATANDKAKCYQILRQNGIAVPSFRVVQSVDEFIRAAFELGHPHRPFCFKPCTGNGSRGFRIVSESNNEADQLFSQKPYNTFIRYAHAVEILSSQPFPPLVVTEFLPGNEYSVDCLANQGKAILAVPRLREKMINGISVKGRFVNNEAIIDYCSQIISLLKLHGNIGIQVKYSANNSPLLLEINPRVQGTIVSALGAGINLPLLAVKQEIGWPIEWNELQVAWNTSFSRYWTEVFY